MPDSIGDTEQRFQDITEQRLTGYSRTLDPPNSDALIGSAITARQALEERRKALVTQLPYSNKRQILGIRAELHGLDMQEHFAEQDANQQRIVAHQQAQETDRAIRRERDTRIDSEGADAMMTMHNLDGALRNGQISKEQFDDRMLQLGQTHFEALHHHPEASKHWAEYLDQDHKMTEYNQRLNLREAAKFSTKYGIPMQVNDAGQIDMDAMQQAARDTPRGKAEALHALDTEMKGRYGLPIQAVFEHAAGGRGDSDATFKQTDPGDSENPQTHVRMTVVGASGKQQNIYTSKERFDAIKNEFAPAFNEIVGSGQQSAASQPQTVKMRAPDGSERDVSPDQVQHYQGLGATLVTQ